jgi:hypothetical protein
MLKIYFKITTENYILDSIVINIREELTSEYIYCRRGCDRGVVRFTSTYAISDYHH